MQAVFVAGPGALRLMEIEPPRAGPGDVVLAVHAVGICGSDLGYLARGGITGPAPTPVPLGHELSGVVVSAGDAVRAVSVGDRVVVDPLHNLIGNGGTEGGFATHLLVRDVVRRPGSLHRLPDGIALETGALVEPLAVALHAVERLGAGQGDRVAVFGAGPIGLAAVLMLRARGVDDVVVLEPSAFRRDIALRLGARAAFDPLAEPAEAVLRREQGEVPLFRGSAPGTTHVLEASGAPVLPGIISFVRASTSICVVSVQKKPVPVPFDAVMAKELILTGALGYPTEIPEVLAMLDRGAIDPLPMVSHSIAAADVLSAFALAASPGESGKVLVRYARTP